MQIQFTDLDVNTATELLESNHFGLENATSIYRELTISSSRIWTQRDGVTGEPQGFECGMLVRGLGSFPTYTLTLDTSRLSRSQVHGLMTDLLNKTMR